MPETFGFEEALRRMKDGAHVGRTKAALTGHHYFMVRPAGVLGDGYGWMPRLAHGWFEGRGYWECWEPGTESVFAVDWYEL